MTGKMTAAHLNALTTADLALEGRAAQARSLDCHAVADRAEHARTRLSEVVDYLAARIEGADDE